MNPFTSNANNEPQPYTIKDKQLLCQHCGNDMFVTKVSPVYWVGEVIKQRTTCFICTECTHMHWFCSTD